MSLELTYPVKNNNPQPLDHYAYNGNSPWASVEEAHLGIHPDVKYIGMSVIVAINGEAREYWYEKCTNDSSCLVIKSVDPNVVVKYTPQTKTAEESMQARDNIGLHTTPDGSIIGAVIAENDTAADVASKILRPGEVQYITDTKTFVGGDGETYGGIPLINGNVAMVLDEAAMLNLTNVFVGQQAQLDNKIIYQFTGGDSSNIANWKDITASSAVDSVNGKTGVVVLTKADVGLPNVDNTSDQTKSLEGNPIGDAIVAASGGGVLGSDLKVNTPNVSVDDGHVYQKDTPLEDIIRDMLTGTLLPKKISDPSLDLKSATTQPDYEVGRSLNYILTADYKTGKIQNGDGGSVLVPLRGEATNYTFTNSANTVVYSGINNYVDVSATVEFGTSANNHQVSVSIDDASAPPYYDSDGVESHIWDSYRTGDPIIDDTQSNPVNGCYRKYTSVGLGTPAAGSELAGAMIQSFHKSDTFTISTGTTDTKFAFAVRSGKTLQKVVDLYTNLTVTDSFKRLADMKHVRPDSVSDIYLYYEMNLAGAYSENHDLEITVA